VETGFRKKIMLKQKDKRRVWFIAVETGSGGAAVSPASPASPTWSWGRIRDRTSAPRAIRRKSNGGRHCGRNSRRCLRPRL